MRIESFDVKDLFDRASALGRGWLYRSTARSASSVAPSSITSHAALIDPRLICLRRKLLTRSARANHQRRPSPRPPCLSVAGAKPCLSGKRDGRDFGRLLGYPPAEPP